MSLDKAISHGKEKRKPYYKSKAICPSCRNHGSCDWCKSNRLYKNEKRMQSMEDMKKEFESCEDNKNYSVVDIRLSEDRCDVEMLRLDDSDIDYNDFGYILDDSCLEGETYSRFKRKEYSKYILDKYGLDSEDYEVICHILEEELKLEQGGVCNDDSMSKM